MKKLLTLLLALTLLLTFVACGAKPTQTSSANNTPSSSQPDSSVTESSQVAESSDIAESSQLAESSDIADSSQTSTSDSVTTSSDSEVSVPANTSSQPTSSKTQTTTSSATNSNTTAHTHKLTTTETKKATCTEDGSKTTTCSGCSYKKVETIKKLGHEYKHNVTKPTCSESGYTIHTCSRCSDTYKDSITSPTGHNIKMLSGTSVPTAKCTACNIQVSQAKNKIDNYAIGDTAYWEDGKLHVQFIIFNTYDKAVKLSSIENYYFDEQTSGKRITKTLTWSSPNITVPANNIFLYTLTVESKHVQNYGIDLKQVGMYAEIYGNLVS